MSTKFKNLYDIADGVKSRLEDLDIFKAVNVAAISNGGQIWLAKDVLNQLPSAVVCIGSGEFESNGLVGNMSVLIIVIDQFKAGTEAKAGGIWPLVDSVCASFMPQVGAGAAPVMPEIDGVEYELKSFAPIESSERVVAFGIELNAALSAEYEIEE
jgi:hypothetical protein